MIQGKTFTNLTFRVKFMFLNNNDIKTVQANAFRTIPALLELDISSCSLETGSLQYGCFSNLGVLRSLQIYNNSFHSYPDGEIAKLESLLNLTIDIFPGFHFSEKFLKLKILRSVKFIPHGLFSLTNDSFQGLRNSPIHYLDLNLYNNIENFCKGLPEDLFCSFPHLQGLSVSFGVSCGIKRVLRTLRCLQHTHLDYFISSDNHDLNSYNAILLNETDVEYLRNMCIRKLILRNNDISGIEFKLPLEKLQICLEVVDLSSNNILFSSSHRLWLTLMLFTPNIRVIKICCQNTQSSRDVSWRHSLSAGYNRHHETRRKQKDAFKIILPKTLEHLDISSADRISTTETDIFIQATQLKFLNVSGTEFPIPYSITLDFPLLTDLDVSYTETYADNLSLQKLVSLESLKAIKSGVITVTDHHVREGILHGLHNLNYIDVSDNHIVYLPPLFFASQKNSNITIIIDRNEFGSSVPKALSILNSIDILSIRDCFESYSFGDVILESLLNLHASTLYLGTYRVGCYCYRKDTFLMVRKIRKKIADLDKITCDDFNGGPKNLQELFSTKQWRTFRLQCGVDDFWLTFSVVLLISTIIVILVAFIVYRIVSHNMMKNCGGKIRAVGSNEWTRHRGNKYAPLHTEENDIPEQDNTDTEVTVFSNKMTDGTKTNFEETDSEAKTQTSSDTV